VTAIVEKGMLRPGVFVGTDSVVGKIKNLENFQGKEIEEAEPGDPVIIVGFESVPAMGEKIYVYNTYEEAKSRLKPSKFLRRVWQRQRKRLKTKNTSI
ncbi:MAG: hypothetical protein PHG23_00875, partial [Candidatus Pacebacteria bacterium]|nr:hypothetical protein [Candidatus Paceibacterota bacterium]